MGEDSTSLTTSPDFQINLAVHPTTSLSAHSSRNQANQRPREDDCCHTIITNTSYPTIDIVKEPCGSNCTRYGLLRATGISMDSFSGITHNPFCCPACIEENLRKRYDRTHTEYSLMGWTPSKNQEKNIRVWTHRLVLKCMQSGQKVAQGVQGIFKLEGMTYYEPLRQELFAHSAMPKHLNATKPIGRGRAWTIRDGREDWRRGRNESPGTDDDMFEFSPKKAGNYRQRSPAKKKVDAQMDGLVDHLFDTKVDLPKDDALMTNLMADLTARAKAKAKTGAGFGAKDHFADFVKLCIVTDNHKDR
ncbi:hypothetical protein K504DRAFT_529156 [Pleomassaria siparia CBS 279.74]|uniref:Uncharacterized protein n=1 Tax=Pleomassaria siparia CBS 279.74 TaxID=1314801 RepID=A0A6G1KQ13_9PLEO|nr:hypothetical protein K504DRAFT_529156 [Pleomassaria siparia CBS 279.74]